MVVEFLIAVFVGFGGFAFGPVPGGNVVMAYSDKQAACCGVGAVDEDLVVDAVGVWGVREINKPERLEAAVESPSTDT